MNVVLRCVIPKYLNIATFSNDSLAILVFWSEIDDHKKKSFKDII
jgi:hypothetical protein